MYILEAFFRWYCLTEERKLFFVEAKLTGAARFWWTKLQQTRIPPILIWDKMKLAMTRYVVPQNYKQLIFLLILDRDVQNSVCVNTYFLVTGKTKYTLTCATHMPQLKFKKNSLVTHRVSNEQGILGLAYNSPRSRSLQRRRVDARQIRSRSKKAFWSIEKCPW